MAWSAIKKNPRLNNGVFSIDVDIFDDKDVLIDTLTFETTQDQPEDWPADMVARWIKNRQEVVEMPLKIQEGGLELPDIGER